MTHIIDENSPTPLYHQIFLVLKDRIRRGEVPDGAMLPNEMQLTEQFKVSRITVKRAMAELAAEGLIMRRRGVGTFVHSPPPAQPLIYGSFDAWFENVDSLGRNVDVELLDVSEVDADAVVAAHLDLEPGASLQQVIRLRKVGEVPFAYVIAWVPAAIAALYDASRLDQLSMMTLLEQAGTRPAGVEQWISSQGAPAEVARAFGMTSAEPMLLLEQVMSDANGAPVQFLRAHYHGERFRYHVKMGRKN